MAGRVDTMFGVIGGSSIFFYSLVGVIAGGGAPVWVDITAAILGAIVGYLIQRKYMKEIRNAGQVEQADQAEQAKDREGRHPREPEIGSHRGR